MFFFSFWLLPCYKLEYLPMFQLPLNFHRSHSKLDSLKKIAISQLPGKISANSQLSAIINL